MAAAVILRFLVGVGLATPVVIFPLLLYSLFKISLESSEFPSIIKIIDFLYISILACAVATLYVIKQVLLGALIMALSYLVVGRTVRLVISPFVGALACLVIQTPGAAPAGAWSAFAVTVLIEAFDALRERRRKLQVAENSN